MINSFKVNQQWFSRHNRLVETLIRALIRGTIASGASTKT